MRVNGVSRGWGVSRCGLVVRCLLALATVPVPAQAGYTVFVPRSDNGQPTGNGLITVDVRDSTIGYAVETIARQVHLQPVFNTTSQVITRRITVHLVNVKATDAFAVVLKGTGLAAKPAPDGETIVISGRSGGERGQVVVGGMVIGRVTDSTTGAALNGALVRVEGVKLSTTTADSGNFVLRNVPPGDQVLQVRLFGYRPATRAVTVVEGERTTVRITMAPVPTVLSGVVTTATGVQRKVEVGNDITSINVDSVMQVAPITSVTDLLETRVPGLTVLHSSGVPGDPSRLRLRGVGSITGNNDPIIVVDGVRVYSAQSDPRNDNLARSVTGGAGGGANARGFGPTPTSYAAPSPIDQIDPASIETIEVFKGPSATAIYGSDAADGVIVITTKHGHAGPTHWSVGLGDGVNWLPGRWPTDYFRFGYNLASQGPICNWYDVTCHVDSVRSYQALNDPRYTVFSHGSDQTASLTVLGGMSALQYSVTGSASGNLGNLKLPVGQQQIYDSLYGPIPSYLVRPDRYQTWGASGQLTVHPISTFQLTLQSNLFNSTQQRSSLEQAITQLAGDYISGGNVTTYFGSEFPLSITPLIKNFVERATDAQVTLTNAVTLAWQPKPWLPLTATGGLNTIQSTGQTYVPYGISINGSDTTGSFGLGRGLSHDQTLSAGTGIPLFRQHLTLALGGNAHSETTDDFSAYTDQLAPGVSTPTTFFQGVNCTGGCGSQSTAGASTYGWYVEPRLNFASRFFAAPGFRLDGGSGGTRATTSGGGVSTGGLGSLSAFPKLDFSYVAVDRQGGRPLLGLLTLLRPRVAFGVAGTQPAPQDRLRLFNTGGYNQTVGAFNLNGQGPQNQNFATCSSSITLGGAVVPAVCLQTLGNTRLHPERSTELEGGVDATLWQGRLTLTYTQYNKTRHDAIISIPVAPSVSQPGGGTFNEAVNIGVVRNTGTELTVNASVLESRMLTWNVGANVSNDNNLLVHLNPGFTPNYFLGLVPGYPLFGRWVHPITSFADINHDGAIEISEIRVGQNFTFTGQPNPKYQLNLTSDLTLLNGRLGVHGTFAYQSGLTQSNVGALQSNSFILAGNNPNIPLSYQAATLAASCSANILNGCGSFEPTPYGLIQTVNTFRFNDLSINYTLPRSVSTLLRVSNASIALQGSNLGLHSNYRGKDPNVNAFSTVSAGDETIDLGQIPQPRTWWLKLNLGN